MFVVARLVITACLLMPSMWIYKVLLFITEIYSLFTDVFTDKFKIAYKNRMVICGNEYHHYFINGNEFVICDDTTRPDNNVIHKILHTRNDILYASLIVLGIEYDITHDMRKFMCYFNDSDNGQVSWTKVLVYCFRYYSSEGLFDRDSTLLITYNDEGMTEIVTSTFELQDYDFCINLDHSIVHQKI